MARAFIKEHKQALLLTSGALLLLAAWLFLGTRPASQPAGGGTAAGVTGTAAAESDGYRIVDASWASLPPTPVEPALEIWPDDECLAKEFQERFRNMDIAIEGR